ncbi:thymidylate kinase [Cyprinid herpesvirus 3]|uniref:dTMP kinase n=1 Tax=Cyprinid herpesvirus 3 TaxID=180230 RepID=Q45RR2_CYHV3|nr:unnamed protein product [Cyprinid herpesvirus 3]AAZ23013.1 thymidylate kinase [Cyprinid herpesvirus 3]ABC55103.1 hypothetical protein [Cyprinid herpesvirus 3]ABG42967.1 thymidylate kinase [Cyprinid herpesvirus 3]AIC32495.1 ORF140R [Cyprinid herpesvirus 3]AJP55627.1 thymidylate kinase [Cyprinid herpesvirus 3]
MEPETSTARTAEHALSWTRRGALIILEGVDRSGKSTQCRMLVKALLEMGVEAELMRFPDRTTPIGQMINSYLLNKSDLDDHVVHLLFSANRWEAASDLKRKLMKGTTIVLDRYAFSGVAFTAAKPGFELEWCKRTDVGLPKPDLVVFLAIEASAVESRGGFGDERYEVSAFQAAVRENFEVLMKDVTVNWRKVDAARTPEQVHGDILRLTDDAHNAIYDSRDGFDDTIPTLWS